jgi:hypothetical protein
MKTFNYSVVIFVLFYNSLISQDTDTIKLKTAIEIEISKMDSLLFSVAFNKCYLALYEKIMSPNLEFYDDRSGLNTSIEIEISSFKDRCSKPVSITRKLVSSTAHILGDYGSVKIGEDEFYVNDKKMEIAKFISIWERTTNSWIVKRAISFDHKGI